MLPLISFDTTEMMESNFLQLPEIVVSGALLWLETLGRLSYHKVNNSPLIS